MKPKISDKNPHLKPRRGFVLLITIMLMVVLTLTVVGLLSLSTLTLRSGAVGEAKAEAKSNARMALIIAIGELQKSMGPDQRVSARASSVGVDKGSRNFTGAWKSWHWRPLSNGPNYSEKADGFERWLASTGTPAEARDFTTAASDPQDPVWLINPKTVSTPADTDSPGLQVSKVAVNTSNRRGAYAWGVMDESLKAPFQLAAPAATDVTPGELLAQREAPPRARAEMVSKSLSPDILKDPRKIVSLQTAVVAAGKDQGSEILGYQQDVTPYSLGLLTNVADGGLKRDLTTLLESTDSLGDIMGSTYLYNGVTGDGVPTWDYLRSHYQAYNRITNQANGSPTLTLSPSDLPPKTGPLAGLDKNPPKERLLPVILRFQLMFSAVSHYLYLPDRIDFYKANGGGATYVAPDLVYDPVITLYNPYDVTLKINTLRMRVWDPPVVFGFQKGNAWLRTEFAQTPLGSGFQGLARFQNAPAENDPNARRYFTLMLGGGNSENYKGVITLQPGEVRVFSPRVENSWTWGNEIKGGTTPRVFFDWNKGFNFGNQDARSSPPNQYGLEAVSGWNSRAGMQTDHLSHDGNRPANTRYSFEIDKNAYNDAWVAYKTTENFSCYVRPGRTVRNTADGPSDHDFRIDLLAGQRPDTTQDVVRSYRFHFADPVSVMSDDPANATISRTFRAGDIVQTTTDKTSGGKVPFALLTMAAKTTADQNDNGMPWLYNQPVVEGVDQYSDSASNALDTYDIRLTSVGDFNLFPGGIQCDGTTGRGFYGASSGSDDGSSNVPMFHVPVSPAASLGDLVQANLASSAALPRVTHPLGNSRANPLINLASISKTADKLGTLYDHSYFLNDALWDRCFFSTAARFPAGLAGNSDRRSLLKDFFEGKQALLNSRLTPIASSLGAVDDKVSELDGLGTDKFSGSIAASMGIQGPFNVNSDSVGAWKALLASLRDHQTPGWGNTDLTVPDRTPLVRGSFPLAGNIDLVGTGDPHTAGLSILGNPAWAGFRSLDDGQIESLAKAIVLEIQARGKQDSAPSATMGEFVNRRIGGNGLHVVKGLLETAIEKSGINDRFLTNSRYSKLVVAPSKPLVGLAAPEAREGYTGEGSPVSITQGDLLMALAPVVTVRGDTFRVRTYGESRDADDKILASAWCEAVVQRLPDYVDPSDKPDVVGTALTEVDQKFGRRFAVVSFRWLSPEEV